MSACGRGDWEDGVDGDKLIWGLVRKSRGARAHTRKRPRARTRARTKGRGSLRRALPGCPRLLPTLVTALAGWSGDREAVTGATRAAAAFPERRGSSSGASRVELRAAGSAATGRGVYAATLSPGRLGGGGSPGGWGRAGPAGGAGRRRPGPTCARPAGRSWGAARGPGHALLPAAPGGGRAPG